MVEGQLPISTGKDLTSGMVSHKGEVLVLLGFQITKEPLKLILSKVHQKQLLLFMYCESIYMSRLIAAMFGYCHCFW